MPAKKKRGQASAVNVVTNKRQRTNKPNNSAPTAASSGFGPIDTLESCISQLPERMDMETIVRIGLKETSQLPLGDKTMSNPIGALVKAYWDLDDMWYDGRVLLYDPIKKMHYIYFAFDGTGEWMDLSPESDDTVIMVTELVVHKQFPAARYSGTNKGLVYVKKGSAGEYVEYFQHTKNKAPEHAHALPSQLKPLLGNWPKHPIAKKMAYGYQNARAEVVEMARIKQLVLDECKKCMMDTAHGYDWIGTRVRASSYALTSTSAPVPSSPERETSDGSSFLLTNDCSVPVLDTSSLPTDSPDPQEEMAATDKAKEETVLTVKCLGTIVDYCPGIDEHFILFDEQVIAPRWLSLRRKENDSKPPEVEVILDWACDSNDQREIAEAKSDRKSGSKSLCASSVQEPVCELCRHGTILGIHGVVTCSVCGNRHLHKHCMPMSRMQLCENQEWRCWYCTCCQGCGTSCWLAPLETISLCDVFNDPSAPPDNIGLCHKCIKRYQNEEKEFCQICFRLYGAHDMSTAQHPLAASTTLVDLLTATDATCEKNDRMIECNECSRWIHSECEGIDQAQYEAMTYGTHPVWGDEYLCPHCRVQLSLGIIRDLKREDKTKIFWEPVTAEVAETYFDVIRSPMDLRTMADKADSGKYKSLQTLRQDFELMCLNALTFNKMGDEYWNDTRKFFNRGSKIFASLSRKTHVSPYGMECSQKVRQYKASTVSAPKPIVEQPSEPPQQRRRGGVKAQTKGLVNSFSASRKPDQLTSDTSGGSVLRKRNQPDSVQSSLRRDSVATLPPGFPKTLHPRLYTASAVPMCDQVMTVSSALYACCVDVCGVCASSGCTKNMIFCVDCGECYHSFCVGAPWDAMGKHSRLVSAPPTPSLPPNPWDRWKCANCREVCNHCNKKLKVDIPSVQCRSCENIYHMKCIDPVAVAPLDDWTCADCMALSPGCESCISLDQIDRRGKPQLASLFGHVFFRGKSNLWGTKRLCLRCACGELFLTGKKSPASVIALDMSCTLCQGVCSNDLAATRHCISCFAPTHVCCLESASQGIWQLNTIGGSYMCDSCWVAVDPRFGSSSSLQLVRAIQGHVMELQVRAGEKVGMPSESVLVDGLIVNTYKAVIVWAAMRCHALSVSRYPSETKVELVADGEYSRCATGAGTFLQELLSLRVGDESVNVHTLTYRLLGRIQSPRRLLLLASRAACFLLITEREWRHMAGSRSHLESVQPAVPLHTPPYESISLVCSHLQEVASLSSEVIQARACTLIVGAAIHLKLSIPDATLCALRTASTPRATEETRVDSQRAGDVGMICTTSQQTMSVSHCSTVPQTGDESAKSEGGIAVQQKLPVCAPTSSQTCASQNGSSAITAATGLSHEGEAQQSNNDEPAELIQKRKKPIARFVVASTNDVVRLLSTQCPSQASTKVDDQARMLRRMDSATLSYGRNGWVRCEDAQQLRAPETMQPVSIDVSLPSHQLKSDEHASSLTSRDLSWTPTTCCVFCKATGEDSVWGRFIPLPRKSCYAHINCVRASSGVIETPSGLLTGMERALERALETKCYLCGFEGASVRCEKPQCRECFAFHLKCATACNFNFRYMILNEKTGQNEVSCEASNDKWRLRVAPRCHAHQTDGGKKPFCGATVFFENPLRRLTVSPVVGSVFDAPDQDDYKQEAAYSLMSGGSAYRLGCLTVHKLGSISFDNPGHYTADYIYPAGFRSSRIYWSMTQPHTRTLYTFEIQSGDCDTSTPHQTVLYSVPRFVVYAADQRGIAMTSSSIDDLYARIIQGVRDCNAASTVQLAVDIKSATKRKGFGHNAHHFFGVGLDVVRYSVECQNECLAMIAPEHFFTSFPMCENLPHYKPRFHLPTAQQLKEVLRRRSQHSVTTRKHLLGCSRAEGRGTAATEVAARKVRNLSKAVEDGNDTGRAAQSHSSGGDEDMDDDEAVELSLKKARLESRYLDLSLRYKHNPEESLCVKRSDIHGWGLFTKREFPKDSMIIEYIGEKVRQPVADVREEQYEQEGVGSCYLFRLDKEFIVDATRTGGMARFMNHCCEPNAYARVVSARNTEWVEDSGGDESSNHIVIFATRLIRPGEEVMYDYKFPVEDVKLPCYCGAAKCQGTMN